jgi:ATPase subunit of ABC transporter with duplicated ATPase domains
MKCCTFCNIEKEDVEFCSERNLCKICSKGYQKQYRQNNAAKIKEYNKRYHENNRESIKERQTRYRQNNRESINERQTRYRQNNVEKLMLRQARKRAKQKNLPFNISEEDINVPNVCPVLGIPLESGIGKGVIKPNSPSLDRANTIKNTATPEEIIAVGEYYKKLLEEAKKNE